MTDRKSRASPPQPLHGIVEARGGHSVHHRVGDRVSREQGSTMAKATMTQVKQFFSVPGKPVRMAEIQELSKEERDDSDSSSARSWRGCRGNGCRLTSRTERSGRARGSPRPLLYVLDRSNRLKPATIGIDTDSLSSMIESWLSADVIAEHLGVTKDSVYTWIAKKDMPAHRSAGSGGSR